MKECDRVRVPALCPTKSLLSLSLIYDVPGISKPSGTGVVHFFSGPLNMSEGACQEIIAGPKTEQVMNIRQPGSIELALFYKPQVLQLLLALQIWKKDITSLESGGLLKR